MTLADLLGYATAYAAPLLVTYMIIQTTYRLFFHPLKDYPGPLVAKVFDGYAAYHAIFRRLHIITRRDHLQYGKVMRHGPNKLVFNSAQALHDIYDNNRVEKSEVYFSTVFGPHPSVWNVIDQPLHRAKRRVVGSILTERSMRTFEPTMLEQVDVFLKGLYGASQSSGPGAVVNMSRNIKYMAMDIVGQLAFGYSLKLQTEDTNRYMLSTMYSGNHRINTYMQYPSLAKLHLEFFVYLLMLLRKKHFLGLLGHMIKARQSLDTHARHDLYSAAHGGMDSSDQPGVLQMSEVWPEALFFFPAGADSVTTVMCSLLFYISEQPSKYQKLADEIRSTFKDTSDIRGGPALSECRYLRACLGEAMRLSPPAAGTLWRQRCSTDDKSKPLYIDGVLIPRGTTFGVNGYTIHHNEEYFPEPFDFVPERWLPEYTPEPRRKLMQSAFSPFSLGYRGCAGKATAHLELGIVIAKIFWHFDFKRAPGKSGELGGGTGSGRADDGRARKGEYQLYDIFTSSHDGPNLVFQSRQLEENRGY